MQYASPLLGGFYASRSLLLNAQRCVNLYPEMVETKDGKTPGALYGTPGLVRILDDPALTPWRGLRTTGRGVLFGVKGRNLYQITGNNSLVAIGLLLSGRGPVVMVDNGPQLLVVDGAAAYGYDESTNHFAAIALPFVSSAPITCAYQDGFFLLNETGSNRWWQSDINDVFTWNGLNFSSKDGQPDAIVTMLDNHREVWLFGAYTTEVWINGGNPGFAFQRLQGVFIQEGCAAPNSAAIAGTSVIWLSKSREGQGVVLKSQGYQAPRISTHAMERQIQSYARIDDAIAYVYQQEGHEFYVLTFPSADATWCYDNSTGLWHERASFVTGFFHRHRSNCCATRRNEIIVGDFENGNLYRLDPNAYTDAGETRKWLRSWPAQATGQITLKNNRYDRLQLYMEPGGHLGCEIPIRVLASSDDDIRTLEIENNVRVLSGQIDVNCADPQVMLRWSDSGGLSWSTEHWRSVGKVGKVKHRVIWNRLGSSRDRIFEVSATDPFKPALLAALVDVEPGVN